MEMSDKAKPLTPFFIEDILSSKDGSRMSGECGSRGGERSPRWEEEPGELSGKLCPREAEFEEQSGESEFFQLRAAPLKTKIRK